MHTLWKRAFLIRSFEERLLVLFAQGKIPGTIHTCSGQEWSALALANALAPNDVILSNHRGHGHFLARHPEKVRPLLAEIMGLREGLCGGVGGSQHLFTDDFLSNGVQGGMVPVAAGLAFAYKIRRTGGVAAVFIGDGTTGEGVLYETMNLAAIWRLPLVIVIENNGYAQSTPTATTIAGDISSRTAGFGFAYYKSDVWHAEKLCSTSRNVVDRVRAGGGPALLEIECFRLNAHSKGDDTRPEELVEEFRHRDPLAAFARQHPDLAKKYAAAAESLLDKTLEEIPPDSCSHTPSPAIEQRPVSWRPAPPAYSGRLGEAIHSALRQYLETHPFAIALGEDIAPPYGGAFNITHDLGEDFPDRVLNTPISEAAITGIGTGLALGGCLPLVEIMFGDFLTLTFDQLQQHAAKFHTLSGGRLRVPLTIRTPMGGRRGYGPTHSQSLEKHFLGIPGLAVVALNCRVDPGVFYAPLATADEPCLVIENKILYGQAGNTPLPPGYAADLSDETFPTIRISPKRGAAMVTIVCYGGMLGFVEEALCELWQENETVCDALCYGRLYPLNCTPLLESIGRTGRLLTVEEGSTFSGWGAELCAQAVGAGTDTPRVGRVGYDGVIPASAVREAELLPSAKSICKAVLALLCG